MTSHSDGSLAEGRRLLGHAARIVVLTGAGVSAESGVPTFRGAGGLWKEHRAEDLATPGAFARDPRLVWEWYGWRRDLVSRCTPNPGHRALAQWLLRRPGVQLVTQNVDGLHERAAREAGAALGIDPTPALPLTLHGSLWVVQCTGCGARTSHTAPIDASTLATLPRCERCDALLRPGVVWFGESLDLVILGAAFSQARAAEVYLMVGTSAVVQPAASLAEVTRASGGAVIEVNLDPTPLTPIATIALLGPAGAILPELLGTDDSAR